MKKNEDKLCAIRIDRKLHYQIKVEACQYGMTLQEYVESLIKNRMKGQNERTK